MIAAMPTNKHLAQIFLKKLVITVVSITQLYFAAKGNLRLICASLFNRTYFK